MGYGSKDRMSPRVYPWWLILVGFVFGVIVTLVVTQARPQQVVVYQPENMQRYSSPGDAVGSLCDGDRSGRRSEALLRPDALDPLLQTATAIVIQATQQAPP